MAPDGGRLLKDMARLFLDLKTQVFFFLRLSIRIAQIIDF